MVKEDDQFRLSTRGANLGIEEKRIAIFQAYCPILSQQWFMAKSLCCEGFQVDFFLHKCDTDYYEVFEEQGIRIYHVDDSGIGASQRKFQAISNRVKRWVERSKMLPVIILFRAICRKIRPEFTLLAGAKLIPTTLIDEAVNVIGAGDYACLIGVEKAGLVWAGLVGERTGLPWLYYSLELFTSDNKFVPGPLYRFRRAEKQYHQKATATIIQDNDRADVLFKDNNIENGKALLVPVSILGEAGEPRSNYLRAKYDIPQNKVIVLQFGQINKRRLSDKVLLSLRDFNENVVLVMHGSFSEGKDKYVDLASDRKVILADRMVPHQEIQELISSADIGLVFYRKKPINDCLTGSASEKLALYLQAGLPVIMFDYPSFRELNKEYQFGICIRKLEELGHAINVITKDYPHFRENAIKAFTNHYEFGRNFVKVSEYIRNLLYVFLVFS